MKGKNIFFNKYYDLIIHASFTKFIGLAKVISKQLNNYFPQKKVWVLWFFLLMKPAEGPIKKSSCRCKKKRYKIRETKTLHFRETWLTELFFDTIHLYKKDTLGLLIWKIIKFLNLFVSKFFGGSLKMSTKYCVTISEKFYSSKTCPREFSFHTIHLSKKTHLVY